MIAIVVIVVVIISRTPVGGCRTYSQMRNNQWVVGMNQTMGVVRWDVI